MSNQLIAIIRGVDPEQVVAITETLVQNGIDWLEVSLSDEQKGLKCIQRISDHFGDKVHLGVGTVIKKEQVDSSVEAGASYIITPGWDKELVSYVLEKGIPVFPGVFTPGEVMQAVGMGIQTVKLFPAGLLGTGYVKSLRGPFPHVDIMAVGGVNAKNLVDFQSAGCTSFAIGSELVPRGATDKDLEFIGKQAREYVRLLNQEVTS